MTGFCFCISYCRMGIEKVLLVLIIRYIRICPAMELKSYPRKETDKRKTCNQFPENVLAANLYP